MVTLIRSVVAVLILTSIGAAEAQTPVSQESLKTVVPPSPNAASLAKYVDWPVDLSSGIPQISVPIYEIKGRSLSLPISLSYHAAGHKVTEVSSWVGLGWTLNAGGVITRSVVGLPDDDPTHGYFLSRRGYSDYNNLFSSSSVEYFKTHAVNVANAGGDAQHDVYVFSAMGRSFKFLFKDGIGWTQPVIETIPSSNVVVKTTFQSNLTTGAWEVILEDGTKLIFGGGPEFIETTTNSRYGTLAGSLTFASSWYLKEIISPVNEKIRFTYVNAGMILSDVYFSESDKILFTSNSSSPGGRVQKIERQNMSHLLLSTISSDTDSVIFKTDDASRLDLPGSKALSLIKIYSKLTNLKIDEFKLETTNSACAPGNEMGVVEDRFHYRLRLNKLMRLGDGSRPSENWMFTYNTTKLPSLRSYAQDHFGYFNGAVSNTTLLPPAYVNNPVGTTGGFYPPVNDLGANREPNSEFMKAEILTKIFYPTGGYTEFEYEPNKITVTEEIFKDTTLYQSLYLSSNQAPFLTSKTISFATTKPCYGHLSVESTISQTILNNQPNVKVTVSAAGKSLLGSTNEYFNIQVPGSYAFSLSTNATIDDFYNAEDIISAVASFTFKTSKGVKTYEKLVGGLRVFSIIQNDGISSSGVLKRYFQYDEPLVVSSIEASADYVTETRNLKIASSGSSLEIVKTRTSTPNQNVGAEASSISYGKVKVLFGINGENGKRESNFLNHPDIDIGGTASEYPFSPVDSRSWKRGLLTSEIDYDASGSMVKKSTKSYSFVQGTQLHCYQGGYSQIFDGSLCTDLYRYCGVTRKDYSLSTEKILVVSESETSYAKEDGLITSLTSSTNYFYDNPANLKPTRAERTNSSGELIRSYSWTALEKANILASYPVTDTTTIAAMRTKNMVSTVIESQVFNQNTLIQKTRTDYKIENGLVVPDTLFVKNAGGDFEARIRFSRYDIRGNLVEQSKVGDAPRTYVWGYEGNYPIAEVVNAKNTDVFYTSFEGVGEGNVSGSAKTGDNSRTGGFNKTLTGLSNGSYLLSYWKRAGDSWVYQSSIIVVANGTYTITISSSEVIDEVRFHPMEAQMSTYAYKPGFGVSSISDVNGVTTYYTYDGFGRLSEVRDADKNVTKTFQYNYKQN